MNNATNKSRGTDPWVGWKMGQVHRSNKAFNLGYVLKHFDHSE